MFENIKYYFILLMMKYIMRLDRLCIFKNHVTRGKFAAAFVSKDNDFSFEFRIHI